MLVFLSIIISACTGSIVKYSSNRLVDLHARVAVIPFSNFTETPLAGEKAMSLTVAGLTTHGMFNLVVYQNSQDGKVLFPGMGRVESRKKLLEWARSTKARYAMTGSVTEWSYKVGLDGEPVVGIVLQLIDLRSGRIVWTAAASKSGGSRIAVSTTAQQLIDAMLKGLAYSKICYVR